jgi:proline iminopeptidase
LKQKTEAGHVNPLCYFSAMPNRDLFPEIEPYHSGHLRVSPLHEIYFEESGKPGGRPILFLHGGPGAGINPKHRRFFDPEFYRAVLFDQRGAGRSLPHAELAENTTDHLIADIEKLRIHLGIGDWIVFGGSWGSTLALAYAMRHRERVRGLILRGIFLGREKEVRWLFQEGASAIFPEAWDRFLEPIPEAERGDLVSAYRRRLTSGDSGSRLRAAQAWSAWEMSVVRLLPDAELIREFTADAQALSLARLECHYLSHGCYLPSDGWLLERAPSLAGIPCRIVQGRYDINCPPQSAWELHKALPGSELRVVPDAGHSASEPGILRELVQAADDFKIHA